MQFTLSLACAFAESPKVTTSTPTPGDQAVDPTLTEIRVEFDQSMSTRGWSWVGGGPTFPRRPEARGSRAQPWLCCRSA